MLNKNLPIDKLFLFAIIQLIAYGSLMMYSASSHIAEQNFGNHLYYLLKHVKWIVIGILLYQLVSRLRYRQIKTIIPVIVLFTWIIILSAFYLNPGNRPSRWLIINGTNWMTTSDLARIMLIIYTAYFIDKYPDHLKNMKFMIIKFTPIPLITLLLILKQPDLSSTIIIGLIILCMLIISKVSYRYLGILLLLAAILLSYKISTNNYMYERLVTWTQDFNSDSPKITDNQQRKALMALGSGGAFGKGLGNSELKSGYLPAAHTDYILPIIGEEYGFFGIAYVFLIFMLIFHMGIQTIKIAPDRFSLFLSLGVIVNIIFYFLINVAYVIGYAPNTGLSLPFISYGGSNTIFTLIGIGLLINISRDSLKLKNTKIA